MILPLLLEEIIYFRVTFLSLFVSSLIISTLVFTATIFLWYKKMRDILPIKLSDKKKLKHVLFIEFCSSMLISAGVLAVFSSLAPGLALGFMSGILISLVIIFPITISDAAWRELSLKEAFIFASHRMMQIVLTFCLCGIANEVNNYFLF